MRDVRGSIGGDDSDNNDDSGNEKYYCQMF